MRIEAWMTRNVLACRPETSLNEAARLMWENDCGSLPVVDAGDRLVGLVTDRDILMGAYTQGHALSDLAVSSCMTRGAQSAIVSDAVEDVIRMMGDHQVRRIPVVGGQKELVGMVSLNDLVRRTTAIEDARTRANLSARLLEAMSSICEPRRFSRELPATVAPAARAERTNPRAKPATVKPAG